MTRECEYCDEEFVATSSKNQKYCSLDCYHKDRSQKATVVRGCEYCGKRFKTLQSRIREGNGKYCSRKCFKEAGRERVMQECECCGNEFKRGRKSQRFCSPRCYWDWLAETDSNKGKNNPNWEGGKPHCVDCGKEIAYTSTRCMKCSSNTPKMLEFQRRPRPNMRGENHPGWIEDRTKLKTSRKEAYDRRYKDWMKKVKDRDNWTCIFNNEDCQGRIEAHHILPWRDYPKLRYEVNNGITVCHYHHPRSGEDEERLIPFFQEMVGSQK